MQTWPFVDISLSGVWQRQLEPDLENCALAVEDSPGTGSAVGTARLKEEAIGCQRYARLTLP